MSRGAYELRPWHPERGTERDPRLDEVVVREPRNVHLEMMDEKTAVMIVGLADGTRLMVRLWCQRGRLIVKGEHDNWVSPLWPPPRPTPEEPGHE